MTPKREKGPGEDPSPDIDQTTSEFNRIVRPGRRKRNRRRCECTLYGGSCEVCRDWGQRVSRFEGGGK